MLQEASGRHATGAGQGLITPPSSRRLFAAGSTGVAAGTGIIREASCRHTSGAAQTLIAEPGSTHRFAAISVGFADGIGIIRCHTDVPSNMKSESSPAALSHTREKQVQEHI